MSPYVEIEHTADWALQVQAPTLETLFLEAAQGMYALAGARPVPGAGQRVAVALQGGDAEALLVAWLQEWLYYTETQGLVFDDFQIEALASTALRGSARGRPAAQLDKLIKAVTYHNLKIEAWESGYRVTIVFDV